MAYQRTLGGLLLAALMVIPSGRAHGAESAAPGVVQPLVATSARPADPASPKVRSASLSRPWSQDRAVDHGPFHNELLGVGFSGPTAWSVGLYFNGSSDQPLIERKAHGVWTLTATPSPGPKHAELDAVAGYSASDAWSVGRAQPTAGQERTLAENWNGVRWSIVSTPDRGPYHNELDSVIVRGPRDAWAVGQSDVTLAPTPQALIEHWDGQGWTIVPGAALASPYSQLSAVAAVPGTHDLWAVGSQIRGHRTMTLVERWNGVGWTAVPSPNVVGYPCALQSVAAASRNDAWAAGVYYHGATPHALIEHWNGSFWNRVAGPPELRHHYSISGIVIDEGRIVAVGEVYSGGVDQSLVIESRGGQWTIDQSPRAGASHNQINGIAVDSTGAALAVGDYFNGRSDRAMVLSRRG